MEVKFIEVGGQGTPATTFGDFEVKYDRTEKSFFDYHEAKAFYDGLQVPASLWDVLVGAELLHQKRPA